MSKISDKFIETIRFLIVYDAQNKPGAWLKRWGARFNNFKDLKSDDIKNIMDDDVKLFTTTVNKNEKR